MSTFSALVTSVKNRCSIGDSTFDVAIKQNINFGQQNFSTRYMWDFLKKVETVTTASGTDTYSLAAECIVYDVRDTTNSLPLKFIKEMDLDKYDPLQTQTGAPYFYLTAGQSQASASAVPLQQIRLFPIPGGTYTILVRSYKRLSDLVNDTDISLIPPAFHELLVNYAANIHFSSQGDSRAQEQLDLYENGLLSAVEQLGAIPVDELLVVKSLDDTSKRGMGFVRFPAAFGMEDY